MIMTDQATNEKLPARRSAPPGSNEREFQINLYCQSALGFPGDGAKQPWDKMTVLEALAILEAASWECKKREVDTQSYEPRTIFWSRTFNPLADSTISPQPRRRAKHNMLREKASSKYFALHFAVSEIHNHGV